MPKITLAEKWTFRSPGLTVEYPAGEHDVIAEIAKAAKDAGVAAPDEPKKDTANGNGTATTAASGAGSDASKK